MRIPLPLRVSPRPGFTLIELLVVIGIIAVLAGLLLGAVTQAQFRTKVAACGNNYRQWGLAVNLYAHDDRSGRLPAFPLPLEKFKSYRELEPWFVSLQMGTNLGHYGVSLPLWYCPARADDLERDRQGYAMVHPGKTLQTVEDMTQNWIDSFKFFGGMEHSWFVPRPLTGSTEVFPDPKIERCRTQEGWPTRLEDLSGATQPILTDLLLASFDDSKTTLSFGKGHLYPRNPPISDFMRNINLLFVDGHVENRNRKRIQWQIENQGAIGGVIAY